jgi:hypothetical protein
MKQGWAIGCSSAATAVALPLSNETFAFRVAQAFGETRPPRLLASRKGNLKGADCLQSKGEIKFAKAFLTLCPCKEEQQYRDSKEMPAVTPAPGPCGPERHIRKRGATSSHMSCSDRITLSLARRPPQLSSARTPLRPSFSMRSCSRAVADAGVPTITLSRSASA